MTARPPMDPAGELEKLSDAISLAVGRNVIALQHLESKLRWLVAVSDISGPASQLREIRARRLKRLRKTGLGDLSSHYTDNVLLVHGQEPPSQSVREEVKEVHFSFRFSLEVDPGHLKERARELKRLVKDRNKLVHGLLSDWNPSSLDSGRLLLERLEEQRRAIRKQFEGVCEEAALVPQLVQDAAAFLMSDDAKRFFSGGTLEVPPPGSD